MYGKSQRMKPQKFEEQVDIEGLRAHLNPHASVYKTQFLPYHDRQPTKNMVLHDKNEDHIGSLNMRYPYESTSRAFFRDWSSSSCGIVPSSPVLPAVTSGCPFGLLSKMKLQGDTQYKDDFLSPNNAFAPSRSRTLSRDTFQYCQGGVPHILSSRSRSRSVGPKSRM
jgi:hypothetical protein